MVQTYHPELDTLAIKHLGVGKPYEYEYKYFFETWTDGLEDNFLEWTKDNAMLPFILSIIYVGLIFIGKNYMKSRPPFSLRMPLAIWSGVLAVFSILGAARTIPELVYSIREYSFQHSVCHPAFYYGVPGFWSVMFVLSKPWELGDTLFIVLRKQNLIFLHWYHHITVMIYAFISYSEHSTPGRWFYVMNYTVHAFMYTYYTLRALRYQIPRWVQVGITSMQISQMFVGLSVFVYYGWLYSAGRYCQISQSNVIYGSLMYLSYFVLFTHFFYNTYMKKRPHKPASQEKKTDDRDTTLKEKEKDSNINFGLPSGPALNKALKSVAEIGRSGYMKKES